VVWGVIFNIAAREKPALDHAEGLGAGYVEKTATVVDEAGSEFCVSLYVADPEYIDGTLRPYSWYKRFIVDGARQHGLPAAYVDTIVAMPQAEERARAIAC